MMHVAVTLWRGGEEVLVLLRGVDSYTAIDLLAEFALCREKTPLLGLNRLRKT